jgi:hypothetical protein
MAEPQRSPQCSCAPAKRPASRGLAPNRSGLAWDEQRWWYWFSIKALNIHWNTFPQGNKRFWRIGMHGDSIRYFSPEYLEGIRVAYLSLE